MFLILAQPLLLARRLDHAGHGGLPIVRHENRNVVGAMVEVFASASHRGLAVPTEGTCERTEYWKSGFYTSPAR
jgi:hypothetical protein